MAAGDFKQTINFFQRILYDQTMVIKINILRIFWNSRNNDRTFQENTVDTVSV